MLSSSDQNFACSILTFWCKLTPKEQSHLLKNIQPLTYMSGQTIYSPNNHCMGIVLIKKGTLRVYTLSPEGKTITLYRLTQEEVCFLSATCLLHNINFDVYVDAEETTEVLFINARMFSELMETNIHVENFVLKGTLDKFSEVMWSMEQLVFMSLDKRLAVFLIDEATKRHSDILPFTHEQVAKYINSAREVVSRTLKHFASENIVQLSRGTITIMDKTKLRRLI